MDAEVRIGVPADEEPMMVLLRQMHAENGMSPWDEAKVLDILRRGLWRNYALIGVIHGPKEIEASIGIFSGTMWYSSEQHLEDLWSFVHPDHRRTATGKDSHAKKLLDFAKVASNELNRPLLMGIINTEQTAAKIRLYRRCFGDPFGAMFMINANLPAPIAAL